jgi:aspartate/methionine/tyrosine aminotransferase
MKMTVLSYPALTGVCPQILRQRQKLIRTDGYETIFGARANVKVHVARPPTYHNYDNYLLPSLQAAYNFYQDKSRIKAVVMCNPTNPIGQCWPKQALVECMEFCQEHGLHLISDEVFALTKLNDIHDDPPNFVSALALTEPLVPEGAVKVDPSRVHVVWSASKLFGSSGFRVVSSSSEGLSAAYTIRYIDISRAASYLNRILRCAKP